MARVSLRLPKLLSVQLRLLPGLRTLSHTIVLRHPRGLRRPGPKFTEDLDCGKDDPSDIHLDCGKDDNKDIHIPVMEEEVLQALSPEDKQVFVDMTFGAGGHTRVLLQHGAQVYALDRDPSAYSLAQQMAKNFKGLHPLIGRFSELEALLGGQGLSFNSVDGILIDAGCSSLQFDTAERGFAISRDGPLDMRMDGDRFPSQPTAAEVVNSLDVVTLSKIFRTYGEETHAKRIATAIVEYRKKYQPIATTSELATVISCAFSHTESRQNKDKLGRQAHAATRTFQGLRIFVNNELNELSAGLEVAGKFLRPGGKLAVLSFHSLEDRIVKRFFQGREVNEKGRSIHQKRRNHLSRDLPSEEGEGAEDLKLWEPANRNKVLLPGEEEIESNPRSRSAKLRVAIKLR